MNQRESDHQHILRQIFWVEGILKYPLHPIEHYKYCIACQRMVKVVGEAF